jgi:hypothetical protein
MGRLGGVRRGAFPCAVVFLVKVGLARLPAVALLPVALLPVALPRFYYFGTRRGHQRDTLEAVLVHRRHDFLPFIMYSSRSDRFRPFPTRTIHKNERAKNGNKQDEPTCVFSHGMNGKEMKKTFRFYLLFRSN